MRGQYCSNCLRHEELKEGRVEHHPHYDANITTPTCARCHVEITSLNCAASEAIGFKRLTTQQRLKIWKTWFVDGLSIFVRGPQSMGQILDIAPEVVLKSLKYLGLLQRAQKSMELEFPCKGVMTYRLKDGTRVLHLHSSKDDDNIDG